MKISTEKHPPYVHRGQWVTTWSAWDLDSYDGAPDSHCPVGSGSTEIEAINDLVEQIVDRLEERNDDLIAANKLLLNGWLRATGTRVVEEEVE
jgi:Uncharacterised protein family (UPF0184)